MRHLILSFIVLQVIFISCKKDEDIIEIKEPGYFVLTELQGSIKTSDAKKVFKSSQSDFNLGEIKASMNYSFILTNGGHQPIFDIALSTDKKSFIVSPKEISRLEGNKQIGNTLSSGFIPVISLGVVHGIQLNGFGFTDLLAMGDNTSILEVTGKTLYGNDTIPISSSYDFTVDAKVMDIKLYVDGSEMDITANTGEVTSSFGGLGSLRVYLINSSNLEIENTGNVNINLTYGSNNIDITDGGLDMLLEPNDKKQISISGHIYFRLDGNGTITDYNRIQLGNDGTGYFVIAYL